LLQKINSKLHFSKCECKGNAFFQTHKIFCHFFSKKHEKSAFFAQNQPFQAQKSTIFTPKAHILPQNTGLAFNFSLFIFHLRPQVAHFSFFIIHFSLSHGLRLTP